MAHKVLFVDDEAALLAGLRRVLHKEFEIEIADSPRLGLQLLKDKGPFAVVVSDLRMPVMDGVQFLRRAAELQPSTVRVMLSGQADLDRAVAAINEGQIFRFVTKPCLPDHIRRVLGDACAQHDLVVAERRLLEETLAGSIALLTDVLEMVSPIAFGRAARVRSIVDKLAATLKIAQPWRIDLAAMLSQLGCVTLPTETLERFVSGQELEEHEAHMIAGHPAVGARLLARIPRLESVARIVAAQAPGADTSKLDEDERTAAFVLRVAIEFDIRILRGEAREDAMAEMRRTLEEVPDRVFDALDRLTLALPEEAVRLITLRELQVAMKLDEDLRAKNGIVLLSRGQRVSATALERLRSFAVGIGIVEPFRVREARGRATVVTGGELTGARA